MNKESNNDKPRRRTLWILGAVALTAFLIGEIIGRTLHDEICALGLHPFEMNFLRPTLIVSLLATAFWIGSDAETHLRKLLAVIFGFLFLLISSTNNGARFSDLHTSQDDFNRICEIVL